MSHILRVMILQCGGLEPNWEVSFFTQDKVEDAIECAKAHLRPDEKTVVQILPLGVFVIDSMCPHVWTHDPEKCDNTCTCGARELDRQDAAAPTTCSQGYDWNRDAPQ